MSLKEDAFFLIEKLEEKGYEAYLVGGCVRDSLLGKEPNDWDICSSALPDEILGVFENDYTVFRKGKKHGTIGVKKGEEIYEITTYRVDKEYKDHRRPETVEFTENLVEDLKRRDFTINAMAMSRDGNITDPFGGKKDLERKIIRAVGDPKERFEEDGLRILRAARFSAQLKFDIEEETYKAMLKKKDLLSFLSADRIRDEFNKIIMTEKPSYGLRLLVKAGLMEYVVPEIEEGIGFDQKSPFHNKDIFEHTMDVVDSSPPVLSVRLSAFFHDIAKPSTFSVDERGIGHFYRHNSVGKDMTVKIMRRLNYDKKTIEEVSNLVNYHMAVHDIQKESSVKRLMRKIGKETVEKLIYLYEADKSSTLDRENKEPGENFKRIFEKVKNTKEPMGRKDLKIDGNDLIEMGVEKGPAMSHILNELLEYVLENPDKNTFEDLEAEVRKLYFTKN